MCACKNIRNPNEKQNESFDLALDHIKTVSVCAWTRVRVWKEERCDCRLRRGKNQTRTKGNGLTKWVVEYAITSLSHNGAKHALLCVKLIFLYSLCIIAYFNASTCLEFQDDTVILDITSINYRQNALLVTDNLQFHFIYFSMINFLLETSDTIPNDQGYFVWNQ